MVKRGSGPLSRPWCCSLVSFLLAVFFAGVAFSGGAAVSDEEFISRLKAIPVSIQCEAVDVALLLRGIARQAGVNIYIPDDLKDTVTLDFQDVTLYDVFETILKAKGLKYRIDHSVIFITRSGQEEGTGRYVARRIEIVVGDADDYVELLTPLLSSKGRIRTAQSTTNQNNTVSDEAYTLTNTKKYIIVMDEEPIVRRIEEMVKQLNHSIGQIYIDAKIVAIKTGASRALGINWSMEERAGELSKVIEDLRKEGDNQALWDLVKNSASMDILASNQFLVGIVHDALKIDMEIRALETKKLAKVLSTPRLLVLDGESAVIKQGEEVPYVTSSRDGYYSNVQFREATLSLSVTPTILPNGYIVLHVAITNDSVSEQTVGEDFPLLNKESMATSLFLKDGVTAVIGGIQVQRELDSDASVPLLSRLPLVGGLFRQDLKGKDAAELLVFLTPRVISMNPFAGLEQALKREQKDGEQESQ